MTETPTWDEAPWMIGGGVEHSTNVARLLAYAAFGGQEGIIDPLNLEVRARAVPGPSVRVAPGACAILNRNPNVKYDAYAGRLPIEDVVDIAATGSSQWRTDLVVARVENPFLDDEPYPVPTPEQVAAGGIYFIRTRVYPGILTGAANTTPQHPTAAQIKARIGNDSAIALGSIAMPASTATVAQAYIRDQRRIAQFRESQVMKVVTPTDPVVLDSTSFKNAAITSVDVPAWATHFSVAAHMGGIQRPTGETAGNARIALGGIASEVTTFNEGGTSGDYMMLMAGDSEIPVPTSIRGTSQQLAFQINRTAGVTPTVTVTSACRLDVVFHCKPEHDAT